MLDQHSVSIATYALCQEGMYLDRKKWKEWLDLYEEDAVYWVPAWRDEYEETNDPDGELSLIFHDSRAGLEERVMRIQSRKSITAMPLPRTTHFVSNIVGFATDPETVNARANWMVQVYDVRTARQHTHFGWSELQLKRHDDNWLISRKKTHLQNDQVPTVIDFYTL
ncbi:aromatic-ring-hydroxylating dioxygenase subunit beta [Paraburkholderia fungorum]|uniref:aromatic-ring-hydroxylating dioxygenase subunit beta n=1 Tax=Paraburkholderia fungorum TaxID=134537 RepID=UPI0006910154|nr:aromatic-ring-hydroxylating dioxygenase subunit beta [Paraburkholderia fungorum]